MIAYDEVLAELHAEADRIQAAITALTALANRQDEQRPIGPVVAVPKRKSAPTERKAKPVAAVQRVTGWKVEAEAMLRAGKSPTETALALGKSRASVYALNAVLGLAPRARGPKPGKRARADAPTVFRCQECGQKGTNPTSCDHCMEKRAA